MRFTKTAITTTGLFVSLCTVGLGVAQAIDDPATSTTSTTKTKTTTITAPAPTETPPATTSTTTTITTPPATTPPPATTTVDVNTAADPALGSTNVQVTTPSDPAATTTNVEVNTLPAPAAAPAITQPTPPVVYENRYVEKTYVEKPVEQRRVGTALTLGGGVSDFTGSNASSMTNTGGYWNARIIAGTRQFLGVEAAYVGSAHDVRALGLSSDAMLVSNGVEGALRLNIPIIQGRSIVEPFAFAGLGWSRYNIARSDVNTSSLANDDDVMAIPYGGGLSAGYGGFMADARFTYRSTFYNDMLTTSGGSAGRLDSWSIGGQMGVEF